MSMTRDDALSQLAAGLRKFEGYTAQQVLDSGWGGLHGLHPQDVEYFYAHGSMPVHEVARACMSRSAARHHDPLEAGAEAQVVLRVPASLKNRWVSESQREGSKLTDWLIRRIERP